MYEVLVVITGLLGIAYAIYYVWHLFWPTVEGKVIGARIQEFPSIASSRRKFKVVDYEFEYGNNKHVLDRQGLFFRLGFAPNVRVGDVVMMRVNPISVGLSCPDRRWFYLLVLLGFQLLFAVLIYIFLTA
ncbi:hypothetical protein ACXYTJ_10310 [Gilvimarinus sp. F26214L]|uniref:hypothetical protein n=1 Tax=Gilvimarinus sp. DZF01 TaxID=3461371 RepID=UPI004046063F